MKKAILLATAICFAGFLRASAQNVPSPGTTYYASVQYDDREFVAKSADDGTLKVKRCVTVVNEKGNDEGQFALNTDKFRKLSKFSCIITSNGKTKKYGMGDLKKTEYSDNLETDEVTYYYNINVAIPYTVTYEFEIDMKDGYMSIPEFAPITDYYTYYSESSYKITVPEDIEVVVHSTNIGKPEVTTDKGVTSYFWKLENIGPLKEEPYASSLYDTQAFIMAEPKQFTYGKTHGSQDTWKNLGLWHASLNKDRQDLSPETVALVKSMTASAKTDYERVKILYDYLAKSTRYVSIQLGIGGYQPQTAATVDKNKFGDCKGLSNYLQSMLNVVGIKSYYTIISTSNVSVPTDYASAAFFDHVILKVELKNKNLWLECTAAYLPMGYIHKKIAGHDALVIRDDGGTIEKLPNYADSLNSMDENVSLVIPYEGHIEATSQLRAYLRRFEPLIDFPELNEKEKDKLLSSGLDFAVENLHVNSANLTKSEMPCISINYSLTSDSYANSTGNRVFIPSDLFSQISQIQSSEPRVFPVKIYRGFRTSDSITINLPIGYQVEAVPSNKWVSGKYGYFKRSVQKVSESKYMVIQDYLLKTGEYPKEEFEAFKNFINSASKMSKDKFVLKKN